jgi:hypothetical protein
LGKRFGYAACMAHDDFHFETGLAWTAFLRPCVTMVAWLLVGTAALRVGFTDWAHGLDDPATPWLHSWRGWFELAGAAVLLLAALWSWYRIATLRSVRLYTNAHGVWRQRGVFPWARNTYGVRWRDLEGATFTGGFGSWLMRSWNIRVGHRFTPTSELVLEDVPNGKRVVELINAMHSRWLDRAAENRTP